MPPSPRLPLRPSPLAAYGLAGCCLCVGLLAGTWWRVRQGDDVGGIHWGDELARVAIALVPYGLLAVAAAWPWTSRAGWWVLGVALAIDGILGAKIALGAPYIGQGGWGAAILYYFQCWVAAVAVVVDFLLWLGTRLWVVARRRASAAAPGTLADPK